MSNFDLLKGHSIKPDLRITTSFKRICPQAFFWCGLRCYEETRHQHYSLLMRILSCCLVITHAKSNVLQPLIGPIELDTTFFSSSPILLEGEKALVGPCIISMCILSERLIDNGNKCYSLLLWQSVQKMTGDDELMR